MNCVIVPTLNNYSISTFIIMIGREETRGKEEL
jgi:hypothetical protein